MAGKMRSPNYPALSLPQALALAEKLWQAEKRTPVSNEAASVGMGFKGPTGPARVAIGALRQYGLIDKVEAGHLRLSDEAVTAMFGNATEKRETLQRMALAPALFQDLAGAHRDASENAIRSYLLTKKGFADDGARKAARAFRETIALAQPSQSGYNPPNNDDGGESVTGIDPVPPQSGGVPPTQKPVGDGVLALTVPYAKGSIGVQIRVTGEALSARHLAVVRKYLQLTESNMLEWPEGDLPEQD